MGDRASRFLDLGTSFHTTVVGKVLLVVFVPLVLLFGFQIFLLVAYWNELGWFLLFSIILAVFSLILLFGALKKYFWNPMRQLYSFSLLLEKGDFEDRLDIHSGDEFEDLSRSLNKATEALHRMDVEHQQLDKAKTEFISITSHELRSPMTPMKAQIQMLMKDYFGKLTQKQKDSLDIVLRNIDRLDTIILDFLEISRIEAARLKFNFQNVCLTDHVNRLVEEMNGFMPEKKITLEVDVQKLPAIEADPDRVMQVMRNLINNAKKFSPENTTIKIKGRLEQDRILFSVKDQGIGISTEDQIRIFEPFFQAEKTMYRKHGGTGLGLAICRGIIESQNGKLWVESTENKGTAFFFTVPLTPVRDIKPIKVLFSSKEDLERKVSEVLFEYLGPMTDVEIEHLRGQGLTYHVISKDLQELCKKGIIEPSQYEEIDSLLRTIYDIRAAKKKIDLPKELENLFHEQIGPMGASEYRRLGQNPSVDMVVNTIDQMKKVGILEETEASRFKHSVTQLYREAADSA